MFYLTKADPLLVLRDLLGHSTVLTTEKYLRTPGHDPHLPGGLRERRAPGGWAHRCRRRAGSRRGVRDEDGGRGELMPAERHRGSAGHRVRVQRRPPGARSLWTGSPLPAAGPGPAGGLAELVHPHGSGRSAGLGRCTTCRRCAAHGPAAGRAGLHRRGGRVAPGQAGPVLDGAPPAPREALTRRMLQGFDAAAGAAWMPACGNWPAGRAFNTQRSQHAAAALLRRPSGTADARPARRSSTTSFAAHHARRWRPPARGRSAARTGGRWTIFAGCWPGIGPVTAGSFRRRTGVLGQRVPPAGRCPARPAGTCSRTWTW